VARVRLSTGFFAGSVNIAADADDNGNAIIDRRVVLVRRLASM